MKTSKFTDEQIAFALRQAETGQRWQRSVERWAFLIPPFASGRKSMGNLTPEQFRKQHIGSPKILRLACPDCG